MNRVTALYRSPKYSPLQHRTNDLAILDATAALLSGRGWRVTATTEAEVEQGRVPPADLYLNMCQGAQASRQLANSAPLVARIVNSPVSVLNCHRRWLVEAIVAAGVPFPQTLLTPTAPGSANTLPIDLLTTDHDPIWVKRGDVHAECPEDVVVTDRDGIEAALSAFAARGIPWAALQANVPGPVIKFYGVLDGRFFRWYAAEPNAGAVQVNEDRLRDVAFSAARAAGLEIFGGDVALPDPDDPVLIDLNDWPSFARFREDAARAIAGYIQDTIRDCP